MGASLTDKKNGIAMAIIGFFLRMVVARKYPNRRIIGADLIPKNGPFLLIANHSSRWDGFVVNELIQRPANYMVSPNELKGIQGILLRACGAFPASTKFDLTQFVVKQTQKGQPIVIFPEGNVFRDVHLHPFKKGAARMVVACEQQGIRMPIVSVAIHYEKDGFYIIVSPPVVLDNVELISEETKGETINSITKELEERVSKCKKYLRLSLVPEVEAVQERLFA
jgi:1-acyl-sn-glycerol-3-phosphate acyltransferase